MRAILVWSIGTVCLMLSISDSSMTPLANGGDKKKDDGWITIFDGKNLNGWHVSAQTGHSGASKNKTGGRWVVENGVMLGSQDIPGNGGIIITDKMYKNFEVVLEMNNDFG